MYSMCTPNSTGIVYDWVEIGCTMYMGIVIVINLKLAMKTRGGGRKRLNPLGPVL